MITSTKGRRRVMVVLAAISGSVLVSFVLAAPAWADNVSVAATAGTLQTAKVNSPFATNLAVSVTVSGGSPEAGVKVTFSAPSSGASGTFSNTGINTVVVTTDSQGQANAPAFTANGTAGSYEVTAVASTGPSGSPIVDSSTTATFYLTNTSTGVASSITAVAGNDQSTEVGTAFSTDLEAEVTDGDGNPVSNVTVSFSVQEASNGSGGTFATGGANTSVSTNSSGVAVAPTLSANDMPGSFLVVASPAGNSSSVSFELTSTAGTPHTMTPGVGRSQSTPTGSAFAIPLSVTVTDSYKNGVPGVAVAFSAPTSGASGTFSTTGTASVTVTTDSNGIAVAPTFTANSVAGGYIVTATTPGANAVAFALVNETSSTSQSAPTDLSAVAGAGTVTLTWSAPASASASAIESYDIYEGTSSGGESSSAVNGTTLISGTSYMVSGLTNGVTYYFVVKAMNSVGISPASNEVSATPVVNPCASETANAAFICSAYEVLLGRAPDSSGAAFWSALLSAGMSRGSVAFAMLSSSEYRSILIGGYYETFLGRAPDSAGLSFWMAQLSAGVSDNSVLSGILGSPEFYANSGGTPGGFVTALYMMLLGRAPDSVGLSFWESQLSSGASRSGVAFAILSSSEYRSDFVEAQYLHLLGRGADSAGLSYWVSQLAGSASNESVIAGIVGSAEFYFDAANFYGSEG